MIKIFLATSAFLCYYHSLSVHAARLTLLGIRWYIYESLHLPPDLIPSTPQ